MEFTESNFVRLSNDEDAIAVILPFDKKIYFKGKVLLKSVISGGLECLGAKITSNPALQNLEVFSPRGYSLLCFQAFQTETEAPIQDGGHAKEVVDIVKKNGSFATVFVLKRLDSKWTDYLDSSFIFSDTKRQKVSLFGKDKGISPLLSEAEAILDVNLAFLDSDNLLKGRLYHPNPEWESVVSSCITALDNKGNIILFYTMAVREIKTKCRSMEFKVFCKTRSSIPKATKQ